MAKIRNNHLIEQLEGWAHGRFSVPPFMFLPMFQTLGDNT
jgi:hypothetical protein